MTPAAAALLLTLGSITFGPADRDWTDAERDEVRSALELLPAPLRAFPGGPLELVKASKARPFRSGDGSEATPDWSEGRRRFHIYRSGPLDENERRARLELERLSLEERDRLWLRRAVVHAVLQRWDDQLGWSRRKAWRRLSGWTTGLRRTNVFEGSFVRTRGATSATLDLVTFAEAWFISPDVLRPDAVPADESVRCQEFSKGRVLQQFLEEQFGIAPSRTPCPAFDAWAQVDALSHLEVLLVAASGQSPESLFGHLLLRPVYRVGETVRPPSLQTVIQIAAMTDSPDSGFAYLARGIFGGYRMSVFTLTEGDFAREVLVHENRTVRRFRLRTSPEENRRILERAWELERRGYFDYRFFTDNCATLLISLLEGALDEDIVIQPRGAFIVSPTSALDAIGDAERASGGRLLEPEWGALPSIEDLAADAERQRKILESSLAQLVPDRERGTLAVLWRRSRDLDPDRREKAWRSLRDLTRTLTSSEEATRLLYAWWALTVRVERRFYEDARRVELEIDAARLKSSVRPPDPVREVEVRQRMFERESEFARREMVLDRAEQSRWALAKVERRPLTERERTQLRASRRTRAAFEVLTALHGDLVEEQFPDRDPWAWVEDGQARHTAEERLVFQDAVMRSGSWRTGIALGARRSGAGRIEPVVALHTAALLERLGEVRVHGQAPATELRVLEAEFAVRPRLGLPEVEASRLTLLAWRSIRRDPPGLRRTLASHFGWGFALRGEHRPDSLLRDSAVVEGDVLAVLDSDRWARRHTVIGLGVAAILGRTEAAWGIGGAPRVSLLHRTPLPGSALNAFRIEGLWRPALFTATGPRWLHQTSASMRLDVLLPLPGRGALLIGPGVGVTSEWTGGAPDTAPIYFATIALEPGVR